MKTQTISKQALDLIDHFKNLSIGKNQVVAPYYINSKGEVGGLRVMVGKGTPEEIEHETKVWAQVRGLSLKKADANQIREFMIKEGIGIDCSGFAVYVLNTELKARGLGQVWEYMQFSDNSFFGKLRRWLRPIENVGANMLTSEENCIKITNLNDIKPADLIRAKGKQKNNHHVAVITKVERNDNGDIVAFEYANSTRHYEDQNGVRIGRVEITDRNGELKNQKWEDVYKGRNYLYEELMVEYEDNGIRRLKILAK